MLSIAPKQRFPLRSALSECLARSALSGQFAARLCRWPPGVQPLSAWRRFATAWVSARLRLSPSWATA